jgi:hypothetical protein
MMPQCTNNILLYLTFAMFYLLHKKNEHKQWLMLYHMPDTNVNLWFFEDLTESKF